MKKGSRSEQKTGHKFFSKKTPINTKIEIYLKFQTLKVLLSVSFLIEKSLLAKILDFGFEAPFSLK
jgi:hypothetical protein